MKTLSLSLAFFICIACEKPTIAQTIKRNPESAILIVDKQNSQDYTIPTGEIKKFKLSSYFTKYVMLGAELDNSIPIVSADHISIEALQKAKTICSTLANTSPKLVLSTLRANNIYIVIFGNLEYPDVIPTWNQAWDAKRYAGGYGANGAGSSCGFHEGDILNNSYDRYPDENIVVHEFAHTIKDYGLDKIDLNFNTSVKIAYEKAKGLWNNTYAISNVSEYWAEGVQTFFNVNKKGKIGGDGIHNEIYTQIQLKAYDSDLFIILNKVFGDASLPFYIN